MNSDLSPRRACRRQRGTFGVAPRSAIEGPATVRTCVNHWFATVESEARPRWVEPTKTTPLRRVRERELVLATRRGIFLLDPGALKRAAFADRLARGWLPGSLTGRSWTCQRARLPSSRRTPTGDAFRFAPRTKVDPVRSPDGAR